MLTSVTSQPSNELSSAVRHFSQVSGMWACFSQILHNDQAYELGTPHSNYDDDYVPWLFIDL